MEFRPCIDIHNGKVKQIVGSSLKDAGDSASENFISESSASYYAELYKDKGLTGGHIIILNAAGSSYYDESKKQALGALSAFPGGMQIGGGINSENAGEYIEAGASHVIVTSYVFQNGMINYDNLNKLIKAVGKERIVLDLSCRLTEKGYMVTTDRWQKITDEKVDPELFEKLSGYCDEFLIHAVDVEGKNSGIEKELVRIMARHRGNPLTYAGGVSCYEDIETIRELGGGHINVTVGSALDLFGGKLEFEKICRMVGINS